MLAKPADSYVMTTHTRRCRYERTPENSLHETRAGAIISVEKAGMSEQHWTCRTREQFNAFVSHVVELWDFEKPLLIKWSVGEKRSLGQNALIHVWIRHITMHMNKTAGNNYDEETVKTYLKRKYGIRIESKDLLTGEPMPALKSYSRYDKGEMTAHMNLVSEFAAHIGCTLPMYGEYLELRGAA